MRAGSKGCFFDLIGVIVNRIDGRSGDGAIKQAATGIGGLAGERKRISRSCPEIKSLGIASSIHHHPHKQQCSYTLHKKYLDSKVIPIKYDDSQKK